MASPDQDVVVKDNSARESASLNLASSPTPSAGGGTPDPTQRPKDDTPELPDEAVLDYLRKKGLSSAALELTKLLKGSSEPSVREKLELDDSEAKSQRTVLARATGGGFGYDLDSSTQLPQWGVPDRKSERTTAMGIDEAKAYVDAFVELQTWVFGLPDGEESPTKDLRRLSNPKTGISLASIVKNSSGGDQVPDEVQQALKETNSIGPPSVKPELLSVTFALLVHTYCELLDVGMETTAHSILKTFRSVYEPHYNEQLADLDRCKNTEDMVRLNSYNSTHLDALARLKAIMVQVANLQLKKDELSADNSASNNNPQYVEAKRRKLLEYDQHINTLNQKYEDIAKVATAAFEKMQDLPFLRRARAVRWQLTLSASAYTLLAGFLSSKEEYLPMNTLLLKQCEIQVEHRNPLPYIPACVLDDNAFSSRKRAKVESEVTWASPVPKESRKAEAGEESTSSASLKDLPFPPYYLDEEYETVKDGVRSKVKVEFNRAQLINGFRRLEAIERKHEYEGGLRRDPDAQGLVDNAVNPLEPSVLLTTLCSSSSAGPHLSLGRQVDAAAIWEESGVGLTVARHCPPDGRRIAAGCDDATVRIWSVFEEEKPHKVADDEDKSIDENRRKEDVKQACLVLLGHKNGFPVFDVNWNRDGRTLLSCGGDGSVRLWDTMAQGSFGGVAKISQRKSTMTTSSLPDPEDTAGMPVFGQHPEPEEGSGAALAVYRGHSPRCPVWSVAFSPSGYYFASSAGDGTGRMWVTDRPTPVRIFSGHTSASVNKITWHPNANYVLTSCDDKTVRMWDIHTGRCVRLMSGTFHGINCIAVSPSGRYAAGADYGGIVHIWDLGTGKKVQELHHGSANHHAHIIHSVSYSSCCTALATGGDDGIIRIWDVRGVGQVVGQTLPTMVNHSPHHSFRTRRTVLMDLHYTKRNLLLAVGKYTAPIPLVVPATD
jgi:hypothetical protein